MKYKYLIEARASWTQTHTGGVDFGDKVYCVDSNHYVTQPNGQICDICNGWIANR